jgi:predicted PurR-regulated permease PerM
MTSRFPAGSFFQRFLVIFGSVVVVVATLALAQRILIPLMMAILLAFILAPLVTFLQRRGLSKVFAVLAVMLLTLCLLCAIGWILSVQIHALVTEIPQHKATIIEKIKGLQGDGEGVVARLLQMIREISGEIQAGAVAAGPENPADTSPVTIKTESAPFLATVTVVVVPVLEILAAVGLIVVLVTFMLILREDLRNRVLRLIGNGRITGTTKALDDAAQRISRFLLMQSVINLCFGLFLGTGLSVIGMPYAPLWGILGGCLRFIPYLGVWVAVLMPLTYAVAVFPGWLQPLAIIGLFVVLEILAATVLEPVLLGHSTGISPVALLLAAVFWAWLWGPIGLLLSTPLTSCLVVLGRYVPDLEFLDILLGSQPALETHISFYQRLLAQDQDEAIELVEDFVRKNSAETVYDEVLLPALIFAHIDKERGELSAADQDFIFQVTRDLLEELKEFGAPGEASPAGRGSRTVAVFGCPARSEADEVALIMLRNLLAPSGCQLQVLSAHTLCAEMVSQSEEQSAQFICIASLSPGGLAQARYLVKRLRARLPGVKISVGRWGQQDNVDAARQRLQSVGADFVATSLLETRDRIVSLLPVIETARSAGLANGPMSHNSEALQRR